MDNYSTGLYVDLNSNLHGEGYFSESIPYVEIGYIQYSFKTLDQVKRSICSRIDNVIKDADFKIVHQLNGKDTKRYLTLINEMIEKYPNKFNYLIDN